ncbi:MAG: alpha/beta hydrolase family protein [Holosporales bacterium]
MTSQTHKVRFANADGHLLDGRLELPTSKPLFFAIFAHCFTCGKDIFAANRIATQLALRGIACLRFDFTGIGGSEGDFAETHFKTNISDLKAAAVFLANHYSAPKMLIGHSLGGTAALAAASLMPSIQTVVTLNAPAQPNHVGRHFQEANKEMLERLGEAEIHVGGRPFKVRRHFFETAQKFDMNQVYETLQAATLVLHAPNDTTVHFNQAEQIFLHLKGPKSLMTLDGMEHLLSRPEDAARIADLIKVWSSAYTSDQ